MSRKGAYIDEDEPLNDTTAVLPLRSKKTSRLQRKQEKKSSKRKIRTEINSFLDLPSELLIEVLSHLVPSDIFTLQRLNHFTRTFIQLNEQSIAYFITARRYWILDQCFPAPIPLSSISPSAQTALLSPQWQSLLKIHRNPYQHIQPIPPDSVCTCMSCVLAWNNLNIVLDLSHWQSHLSNRQPLPVIQRGTHPEWNTALLSHHADIILTAMKSPLAHARILQIHLATTTSTIQRFYQSYHHKSNLKPHPKSARFPKASRLYNLSDLEVENQTDEFLSRKGPPSYQPIYMRDNYYSVEAFVPNRKWDRENERWAYYWGWPRPHEGDLGWLVGRFGNVGLKGPRSGSYEGMKDHLTRSMHTKDAYTNKETT